MEGCDIVLEYCFIDVNDVNIVLIILKEKKVRRYWDKFYVGSSEG